MTAYLPQDWCSGERGPGAPFYQAVGLCQLSTYSPSVAEGLGPLGFPLPAGPNPRAPRRNPLNQLWGLGFAFEVLSKNRDSQSAKEEDF